MTEELAPEASAPMIVFTMPSLRFDDDVHSVDDSTTAGGSSEPDERFDRDAADDDGSTDPIEVAEIAAVAEVAEVETVAEDQPDSPFAPPTPDTRAEYMYALVELERQRILDAAEPKRSIIERLREREH